MTWFSQDLQVWPYLIQFLNKLELKKNVEKAYWTKFYLICMTRRIRQSILSVILKSWKFMQVTKQLCTFVFLP